MNDKTTQVKHNSNSRKHYNEIAIDINKNHIQA